MTIEPGAESPLLDGSDEQGNRLMLPALERWTHLWFNPIFGRYGCKSCQTSLIHELHPELRLARCRSIGLTYDPPEVNARRNEPHIWRVPLMQITPDQAREWGALRDPEDSWFAYTPRSRAVLIDPQGVIRLVLDDVDHRTHARDVLDAVLASLTTGS